MTQSILPAVPLVSLPFLNFSLTLLSSHFWLKHALIFYVVWRRHKKSSVFHLFILLFVQLPWKPILKSSLPISFFTQASLASPFKLHPSRYSEAYLPPEARWACPTFMVPQFSHAFINSLLFFSSLHLIFYFLPFDYAFNVLVRITPSFSFPLSANDPNTLSSTCLFYLSFHIYVNWLSFLSPFPLQSTDPLQSCFQVRNMYWMAFFSVGNCVFSIIYCLYQDSTSSNCFYE